MEILKLYQVDDWIKSYLKSWGYENEMLVQKIFNDLKRQIHKNITPQDVMNFLDNHILMLVDEIWETDLRQVEKLNYFKMVFLMDKGYEKCQLFLPNNSDTKNFISSCLERKKYLITPDIIPANMYRQSIKTFHPIWKLKKAVVKGVQKVISTPKKKTKK